MNGDHGGRVCGAHARAPGHPLGRASRGAGPTSLSSAQWGPPRADWGPPKGLQKGAPSPVHGGGAPPSGKIFASGPHFPPVRSRSWSVGPTHLKGPPPHDWVTLFCLPSSVPWTALVTSTSSGGPVQHPSPRGSRVTPTPNCFLPSDLKCLSDPKGAPSGSWGPPRAFRPQHP